MMHKAWCSIVEVPYRFSRSYVKFQGHTALKIFEFDPNWAFRDCNSSLNSPMAMKCCTKLETAKERCPIVFQGHPSNFKVTRDKTSPMLTQIGRFRTTGSVAAFKSLRFALLCYCPLVCFVGSTNMWYRQSLALTAIVHVIIFALTLTYLVVEGYLMRKYRQIDTVYVKWCGVSRSFHNPIEYITLQTQSVITSLNVLFSPPLVS